MVSAISTGCISRPMGIPEMIPARISSRMKVFELLTDIPAELNLCAGREIQAFILRNLVSKGTTAAFVVSSRPAGC
ncbi:hypothetical protein ACFSQD_02220 [Flavihumibacter stibioxidans]|uniref:hypothetical protein n=1 Tax=Flavihumibacter stibioxidans TaxID=1834163 RepID=UPI00164FE36C|nr:hypothetical protein [Flavihumibacter stibioxidans]